MAILIYGMLTSLDGYTEDASGNFDWAEPDDELHQFVNDVSRPIGTLLYGRKMYETMVFWETAHLDPGIEQVHLDWANLWRAADKVVYSKSLDSVASERTAIERRLEPGAIRTLKSGATRDISISGPHLAAAALHAGLVDEIQQYICPAVVGGGTKFLPDGLRLDLELVDERKFAGGAVFVSYRVKHSAGGQSQVERVGAHSGSDSTPPLP